MSDRYVFKRHEIKFRIRREQKAAIIAAMLPHMVMDEHGRNIIQSLYFDTPDFLLIRRSMEHPQYKEKLRARSYGVAAPGDEIFLELKKKYKKVVCKRRMTIRAEDVTGTMPLPGCGEKDSPCGTGAAYRDRQIAREIAYCRSYYGNLEPKVLISYEREAWFGGGAAGNLRVTFDGNILWRDFDLDLTAGTYGYPILGRDEMLMEIKTGEGIPVWMTEILSREKIYKTSFSKYGRAFELIRRPKPMQEIRGRGGSYGFDHSRAI